MNVLQIAKVEAESLNLTGWLLQGFKDALEAFVTDLAFLEGEALQWSVEKNIVEELANVLIINDSIHNSDVVQSSKHTNKRLPL